MQFSRAMLRAMGVLFSRCDQLESIAGLLVQPAAPAASKLAFFKSLKQPNAKVFAPAADVIRAVSSRLTRTLTWCVAFATRSTNTMKSRKH